MKKKFEIVQLRPKDFTGMPRADASRQVSRIRDLVRHLDGELRQIRKRAKMLEKWRGKYFEMIKNGEEAIGGWR